MDLDGLLRAHLGPRRERRPPQARPAARSSAIDGSIEPRRRASRRSPSRTSSEVVQHDHAHRARSATTALRVERRARHRLRVRGGTRFRVNAFRQRGAISVVCRVIPREIPSFETLHLPPGVRRLAEEHRGLVLVTGATGSGKSTTLAAMIDHINRTRKQHIITIEDPIEMLHPDRSVHRQPARGRDRHRLVLAGAAPRAPPGPRRDPDRRAPRLRDRRDGAAGGRVGPPRPLDDAHGRRRRDDRPHDRVLPGREAADDPLDPRRRAQGRRQPAAAADARRRAGSPPSR